MFRVALAFSLAALAAASAHAMPSLQVTAAPDPSTPDTSAATAVTSDRDPMKVVCRAMRPPTGTRIQTRDRVRICQSQEQWDAQATEAQGAARDAVNGSSVNNKEFLGPGGISPEGGPH